MSLRAFAWILPAILLAADAGAQSAPAVGKLPATFQGILPCADCEGIRYQINVLPRGAYMQSMTFLREGEDVTVYEVGKWIFSSEKRWLTLESGAGTKSFWAVKNSEAIRKLDSSENAIESNLPYDLSRAPALVPIEPRVKLRGMFRATADAARFRDCLSGLSWPVAMGGDYRALESEYAKRRSAPGAELLVLLEGRIEGARPTLFIIKFGHAMPGEVCAESEVQPGLTENRWRPTRIAGNLVEIAPFHREPWMELDSRTQHVTGSGGCNEFSTSFKAGNGKLKFGPIVSSKAACPSMPAEQAFYRALEGTRGYRIKGRVLELLDEKNEVLAQLEERNLR